MPLQNITVDDFDSQVSWGRQEDWLTPNPQDNPAAFQTANFDQWHEATHHRTSVVGTEVALNFTGSTIYIWGASGPTYGSYSVKLDSLAAVSYSAFSENYIQNRQLLYSADLVYGDHSVVVKALGAQDGFGTSNSTQLLIDLFEYGVELGAQGATLTNTTLQETDSRISYKGTWDSNSNPLFSGGSTTYTNTDSSFSFDFEGSAVWIYGDQVNDHGLFSVKVNGTDEEIYDNGSGCGGGFAKTCEKLGTLAYFKGSLPQGRHTIEVTNLPGANNSFIDIDQIIYTTPSIYSTRLVADLSSGSPFLNGSTAGTGLTPTSVSAAPSATGTSSGTSAGMESLSTLGPLAWGALGLAWIVSGMKL